MAFERRTYRGTGAGSVNVQTPQTAVRSNRAMLVTQGLRGIGKEAIGLLNEEDYDAKNRRLQQAMDERNQRMLMNLPSEDLANDKLIQKNLYDTREQIMGGGGGLFNRWGKKNKERAEEDYHRLKEHIIALRRKNFESSIAKNKDTVAEGAVNSDTLREAVRNAEEDSNRTLGTDPSDEKGGFGKGHTHEKGKLKRVADKFAEVIKERTEKKLPPEVIGQPDVMDEHDHGHPHPHPEPHPHKGQTQRTPANKWHPVNVKTGNISLEQQRAGVDVVESRDGKFRKGEYFQDVASPYAEVVYPHRQGDLDTLNPIMERLVAPLGGDLRGIAVETTIQEIFKQRDREREKGTNLTIQDIKKVAKGYKEEEFRALVNATYLDEGTDGLLDPLIKELKKQGVTFLPEQKDIAESGLVDGSNFISVIASTISPAELEALKKDHGRHWREVALISALNVLGSDAAFRGDLDQQRVVANMTAYLVSTGKIRRNAGQQVLTDMSKGVQQEFEKAEIRDKRSKQVEALVLEHSFAEYNKAIEALQNAEGKGGQALAAARRAVAVARKKVLSHNPQHASAYAKLLNLGNSFVKRGGNAKQFQFYQRLAQQYLSGDINAPELFSNALSIAGAFPGADPNFAISFTETLIKAGGERRTEQGVEEVAKEVSTNAILGVDDPYLQRAMQSGANKVLSSVIELYMEKQRKLGRDVNVADANRAIQNNYLEPMALYGIMSNFFPDIKSEEVAAEILRGPGEKPTLLARRPLGFVYDALEDPTTLHRLFGRPLSSQERVALQKAMMRLQANYGTVELSRQIQEDRKRRKGGGRKPSSWEDIVKRGRSALDQSEGGE